MPSSTENKSDAATLWLERPGIQAALTGGLFALVAVGALGVRGVQAGTSELWWLRLVLGHLCGLTFAVLAGDFYTARHLDRPLGPGAAAEEQAPLPCDRRLGRLERVLFALAVAHGLLPLAAVWVAGRLALIWADHREGAPAAPALTCLLVSLLYGGGGGAVAVLTLLGLPDAALLTLLGLPFLSALLLLLEARTGGPAPAAGRQGCHRYSQQGLPHPYRQRRPGAAVRERYRRG